MKNFGEFLYTLRKFSALPWTNCLKANGAKTPNPKRKVAARAVICARK